MRKNYRIGVPEEGEFKVVLSSDSSKYGGTGTRLLRRKTRKIPMHGFENSISVDIPGFSCIYLKLKPKAKRATKKTAAKTEAKEAVKAEDKAEAKVKVKAETKKSAAKTTKKK